MSDPDDLPTVDDFLGDAAPGSPDADPRATPPDEQPADDGSARDPETEPSPNDTPEVTDLGDDYRLISEDVSCENCSHRDVCSLQQGIAPMLASWNPGAPPIDLVELAVICDMYDPEGESD